MLRLANLETAGGDKGAPSVSESLLTQALGNLLSDRMAGGNSGFAIEKLCAALVDDKPSEAQSYIDRLLDCGVSVEAIYETYIPRAAMRLGDMWVADTLSFAAVTLGMARLTEVFRRLSPLFLKGRATQGRMRRALFALVPGENHSLGVAKAADYFQRAGWSVRVELQSNAEGLGRLAQSDQFDLVGLSAGSRRQIPMVGEVVSALRQTISSNIPIILGGPLVALEKSVALQVGVDLAQSAAACALAEVEKNF